MRERNSTPRILGILNTTTDSFSDGKDFLEPSKAVAHADEMWASGASMIDVGAASSNVSSSPVSADTEIARLAVVLPELKRKGMLVSVDTFKPEVQRWCLQSGLVDCINDIQGFPFPEVYEDLAGSDAHLILMHSVQRMGFATEVVTDPVAVFDSMMEYFHERIGALTAAGVSKERIILDPGMGNFLGSNPETSVYVIRNIRRMKSEFSLPVMIALSRKSFLANISSCDADKSQPLAQRRSSATLAAELFAAQSGADWLRTHDVKSIVTALEVDSALRG